MRSRIDHLVVVCESLEQGDEWLHGQLGVRAQPGGRHATMGTHNRLLRLGDRCYLELLAIDPAAPAPGRPRWFGLDDPVLHARIAGAPSLRAWVVACDDAALAATQVPALGDVCDLERGSFRWRLTVSADGRLPFDGALPGVIQWLPAAEDAPAHPCDVLPLQGCELQSLRVTHPAAAALLPLYRALRIEGPVELASGPAALVARIETPSGPVELRSPR